ncbi:MAG: anaerobic glycerol-3-phosphate dehydrogenase subunit C, partial [Selenomonadaceae bacterium]|nr:anaerobic glycerol-3-phosphate dehydrogenase subunit C [Selenomonadaceae bacterium]
EEEMKEAATNVYDAFEFLAMLEEEGKLNTEFKSLSQSLLYHVPCHLKSQGFGTPAARILGKIPGVKVELADAGCCGMSGNYGFKQDKYEISMKIGEELFGRIKTANADKVISDCGTCRLQIQHGGHVEPCHPIEILEKAY